MSREFAEVLFQSGLKDAYMGCGFTLILWKLPCQAILLCYSRAAQTVCVKFPPYVVKLLLNYLHENNKKIAELLLLDICDHLSIVQQIAGFWSVVFISVSFTLSLNKRWMFTIV